MGRGRWEGNKCGACPACFAPDCGQCLECLDKPKFGGKGVRKKLCRRRLCRGPTPAGSVGPEIRLRAIAAAVARSSAVSTEVCIAHGRVLHTDWRQREGPGAAVAPAGAASAPPAAAPQLPIGVLPGAAARLPPPPPWETLAAICDPRACSANAADADVGCTAAAAAAAPAHEGIRAGAGSGRSSEGGGAGGGVLAGWGRWWRQLGGAPLACLEAGAADPRPHAD
mmetsp:Transcript_4542/g.14551  ORF Transcript_4542/g.14551 Transcript_4542/m.14551 type:complete len:225 (-) Transcript_4542:320-994(-)